MDPADEDGTQRDAEWTTEQRREFRQTLEVRHRRQVRGGQAIAATLILIVATGVLLRLAPDWWVPAVGVVALAGLVFRLANWKCPACGERLPTRGSGEVCPGCGLPLR